MKLFKLTGNSSTLKLSLEHPIQLNGNYSIGLSGFYSDNFVLNFPIDVPYCYGFSDDKNITEYYPINRGFYTIESLKNLLKDSLKQFKTKVNFNENDFMLENIGPFIRIKSPVTIIVTAVFVDLFGFEDINIKANTLTKGIKLPKLRPFDVIEIHCNLVEPSLENHKTYSHLHKESDILYSFFPNVEYGSKISEKPNEIDYVPLRELNKIQSIEIKIQDENGNLLNNSDVKNIVYLRLRKNSL